MVADGAAEPGYSESDHSAVVGVDNALLPLGVSLSRPGVKFVITKVEAVLHSEWRQGPVVRPYGILRTDVAIEPKHYDVRRWPAIEKRGSKIAEVGVIGGWRGGILSQNKTLHFSVAHDCLETERLGDGDNRLVKMRRPSGTAGVGMDGKGRGGERTRKISFFYVKKCDGGSIPGLEAHLGFSSRVSCVSIQNGQVGKPFMMSKVGKYSGMAMIVRRGEERSRLYFSMRRPQTLVVFLAQL